MTKDQVIKLSQQYLGWYVLNKCGVATLCKDYEDAQDVAAQAFVLNPRNGPYLTTHLHTDDQMAAAVLAARNAALEEAAQKAFSWNTAMTDTLAKEIRELKEPTT